ncbi:hypothetical protein IOD13_14575 [Brevibacterium casei]|nr:hypothetical protein [Brevibacterium casei]
MLGAGRAASPSSCGRGWLACLPRRGCPRPLVLGAIAAVAEVSAADLVRIVAYDDAQTVAAATLKLEPMDPIRATGWVLGACTAIECFVADLATLTVPGRSPRRGTAHRGLGRGPVRTSEEAVPCLSSPPHTGPCAWASPGPSAPARVRSSR